MKIEISERLTQKIGNLKRAVQSLEEALKAPITEPRDIAGIIKNFEFCYELSWKILKTILEENGKTVFSPRATLESAFEFHWIENPDLWPNIIKDRNLATHTYDDVLTMSLVERIKNSYFSEFKRLEKLIIEKTGYKP